MLGLLGRRAIDLAVLFLALYAFAFVPLGKHTGLEHLRRILDTPAAKSAGQELALAATRLRARLLGGEEPAAPTHGTPVVPKLPRGRAPADLILAPSPLHDRPDASL